MSGSNQHSERRLTRCWPGLLIGAAWLLVFWPMLSGQTVVGFRDSAYLYYPLFQWIDAQWAAGQIPLWNPFCNFGMPVVGDGTTSVFYPGKLIFCCRFLSFPARYGIYLAVHIPLAAAGTYWFAKTLHASRAGATLAAFAFAFGGPFLFQVTNVVFLVSAAWLPFAICCVWKMAKTGRLRWAVGTGVCCALMILGGDPQMVYHVGLIAAATMIGELVRRQTRRIRNQRIRTLTQSSPRSQIHVLIAAGVQLLLMIGVTVSLAAVQLLPTAQWAAQSERMDRKQVVNLYDAVARRGGVDDLIGAPLGQTGHAYQFSQPPWTIAELFWPNVSGKPFPTNARWTDQLAGAERVWTPSIYMGILVAWLGLAGIRLGGRRRRQVWLSRVGLFFGIASFGWYGVVWMINELLPQPLAGLGPQVGGIYWAMNMLLPKYFAFRYPAKLLMIASLALSVLAGINLKRVKNQISTAGVMCFLIISLAGGLLLQFHFRSILESGLAGDWQFGPFDSTSAIAGLYRSLIQSTVILLAARLILSQATHRRPRHLSATWIPVVLVWITAGDVLFANRWLVPDIDAAAFESRTQISQQLDQLKESRADQAPVYVLRRPVDELEPASWPETTSHQRLSEIVAWQRESLYPKHHLSEDVVLIGSFTSIWPVAYQEMIESLDRIDLPSLQRGQNENVPLVPTAFVSKNPDGSPALIALESKSKRPAPIHWLPVSAQPSSQRTNEREQSCEIVEFGINRMVARVSTNQNCQLAIDVIFDPGWHAEVLSQTEIGAHSSIGGPRDSNGNLDLRDELPTERKLKKGQLTGQTILLESGPSGSQMTCTLPAGRYEIALTYRPQAFWWGAVISVASWCLLLVGSLIVWRRSPA